MKGFIITALTDQGSKSLIRCIRGNKVELSSRPLLDRLKFHKIWHEVIDWNPLKYSLFLNSDAERFVFMDPNFSLLKCASEVEVAMILEGSHKGIDFTVEVFDGD